MSPEPSSILEEPQHRRDRGPVSVGGDWDAVVIGAGFGGLGAALSLAEQGARVLVCEALTYPGGCASTFERGGHRFESGATLFSGLGPEELFGRWRKQHGIELDVEWLDPLVELRAPGLEIAVRRDRERFVSELAELPGAPRAELARFFTYQRRSAEVLWELFRDPSLLPPFDLRALLRHAVRAPRMLGLAACVGRPLSKLVERHGLAGFDALGLWLDATCQITLQERATVVEAPFALAAMDYFWRGTGHVRGGIGELAWGLTEAIRRSGGEVALACAAKHVERVEHEPSRWRVRTRRGNAETGALLTNVLPQSLRSLTGGDLPDGDLPGGGKDRAVLGSRAVRRLTTWGQRVESGWGACMLYRVVKDPGVGRGAHHLQLVQDAARPLTRGNHLFVSVSSFADPGRCPPGFRTLTASTHVPLAELRALPDEAQAAQVEEIQASMRRGLGRLAPEWDEVATELTASPRTFERFTGRFGGYVGGVPRRAGWRAYRGLFDGPLERGLHLVGDSVFPGQSTLAAALGGVRAAERVRRGR